MKKIALMLVIMFCFIPLAYAESGGDEGAAVTEEKQVDKGIARCPFNMMTDQDTCMKCHETIKKDGKFKWGVQDEIWRSLLNKYASAIIQYDGEDALYYKLTSVDSDQIREAYEFMVKYGMKYLELEVYSPGGSVVEAWRIQSMIREYEQKHGITTATIVRGYAASAGMIILASGTKGHRYANPYSEIMCHELWSITWLAVETPSSTKDKSDIMAHFQNNINRWLVEVSNVTEEYIADKIHKKDWWMWGDEAKEMGFVDHFVYNSAPTINSHVREREGN